MTSGLRLSGVRKVYGEGGPEPIHAVRSLDLAVERGEIVALLGGPRAGKTTILRLIAGLEAVSDGSIVIDDVDVTGIAAAARDVAMAFENAALYPPLTAREHLAFALEREKLERTERDNAMASIARAFGIEAFLDRKPKALADFARRRLGLARALARDAAVHLLDRPARGIEPPARMALYARLRREARARELAVLIASDDPREAFALADRVAVIEDGAIQQIDRPDALIERPGNMSAAALVAEPPINLLFARTRIDEEFVAFVLSSGDVLAYEADEFEPALRERLAVKPSVALGVWPNAVRLEEGWVPASVERCEWLGERTRIASAFAGLELISSLPGRIELAPGDRVELAIEAEDLHLFDPDSEQAIGHDARLVAPHR